MKPNLTIGTMSRHTTLSYVIMARGLQASLLRRRDDVYTAVH